MKRKRILLAIMMICCMSAAGCGKQSGSNGSVVENGTGNEKAYGMEATAPKTTATEQSATGQNDGAAKKGTDGQNDGATEQSTTGQNDGATKKGTDGQNDGATEQNITELSDQMTGKSAENSSGMIGEDAAKKIVLEHAGVTETEIRDLCIVRERDDGYDVYDVEFYVDSREYDYDIDVYTGEIRSFDYDMEGRNTAAGQNENAGEVQNVQNDGANAEQRLDGNVKDSGANSEQQLDGNTKESGANTEKQSDGNAKNNVNSNAQQSDEAVGISQEEALALVLDRVPGAAAEHVEIELEMDDGHWKYEGEIHYNKKEYEFELNAENGQILEWSEDADDD